MDAGLSAYTGTNRSCDWRFDAFFLRSGRRWAGAAPGIVDPLLPEGGVHGWSKAQYIWYVVELRELHRHLRARMLGHSAVG